MQIGKTSASKLINPMTTTEILLSQQEQIDKLLKIIEDLQIHINWQKVEIKLLEQERFVRTEN